MNSAQDSQYRTLKAKKGTVAQPQPLANPGHSGPTTFFLRSEKDVEKSTQRGRKTSRDSDSTQEDSMEKTPMASMMGDSSFGVESLENTISSSFSSDNNLSRIDSNVSEASVEGGAESSVLAGRKRKAGNPVHPKIMATGQRILSAEHTAPSASGTGSPMSYRSAESPMRMNRRRGSAASSINLSQPLTPLKMSPQPESAMPSTPRSGSPKSFRLSDEEASIASETRSQAIESSSGEEDNESASGAQLEPMPQLVMPSITMPARRPFTEKGRRMGRLKIMVVGPQGIGKTSLIRSICRVCEDVVHLDPINRNDSEDKPPNQINEVGASTRSYPSWWTDFETRGMLCRRKSLGEGVLERNLTFIDTPGIHYHNGAKRVLHYFKTSLSRTASMAKMNDIELISMLSGEGGLQIDAVIYMFQPTASPKEPHQQELEEEEVDLLRYLLKWTNVVPVIGNADRLEMDELAQRKEHLNALLNSLKPLPRRNDGTDEAWSRARGHADEPIEPFAVSSALGDDLETIDASVLMSSTYLPPFVPSELQFFVNQLLEPDNTARLRHLSATKLLFWRQEHLGPYLNLEKQMPLRSPRLELSSPAITSSGSMPDDPSKVLVPHGESSYFRSASPSVSDTSALSGGNVMSTSAHALARHTSPSAPFRQVRLAKWAQDLQRSLDNERRRYKQMYAQAPSDWLSSAATDSEKASDPNQSLVTTSSHRPPKGRLGGDLAIIDPRDPLGVLAFGQAFRRRSWFALQLAGSCGLIGAVAWWVMRNWADVQDFLGVGQSPAVVSVTAVPPPPRSLFDTSNWKGIFGWER